MFIKNLEFKGKRKGAEHPLCGQGALGVRLGYGAEESLAMRFLRAALSSL